MVAGRPEEICYTLDDCLFDLSANTLVKEREMARSKSGGVLRPANLQPEQIRAALLKIEKRLADIDAFDISSVSQSSSAIVQSLSAKLDGTLAAIFGSDTEEYARHQYLATAIDKAPIVMGGLYDHDYRGYIQSGINDVRVAWTGIRQTLEEAIEDSSSTTENKVLRAYEGLQLHAEIERAAGKLFIDGHYSNAIEDSVKALNAFVRLRSGVDDLDGMKLMERVFNPTSPVLRFNELKDQSDRDEQKGFMMMFSGAVAGLRNPRAHTLTKDDPERALEFIAFVSLLAKLADQARK